MKEEDLKAFLSLDHHPGYKGAFTRFQLTGAYRNGLRIVKVQSEASDATRDGTLGTVLGSINHPERGIGYFIEWDDKPKVAMLVIAWKVAPVS